MKRFFTLALAFLAFCGGNAFAQEEEDMTSYVVNAGFDEDFTWQADGSKKSDAASTGTTTNRSTYWTASDSTCYAVGKATRSDGYEGATNGFIGRVKGWKVTTSQKYPNCEWVYFGSVPYALDEQAVPVADDGTTFLAAPTEKPSDDNGDDNLGALYLRAGWGNMAAYSQKVDLPCAKYRLEYWVLNANYEDSKSTSGVTNLCQVVCRRDTFADTDGFAAEAWTKHEIEFTPVADFTIQFGFKAANAGSGKNPYLWIDGIKLYKIAEADESEILLADIYYYLEELETKIVNNELDTYDGLIEQMEAISDAADQAESEGDLEAMHAVYEDAKAMNEDMDELIATDYPRYSSLKTQADELLANTKYDGYDTFQTEVERIEEAAAAAKADEFGTLADELEAAINAYVLSQPATKDNPADYTKVYFPNPYFTKESNQPTVVYNADGTVASVTYPMGTPDDANGTGHSAYGSSDGWYKAGTTSGDQRLNTYNERICWNAWRMGTADVAVATDLTDLPNGYYKVSAEMTTQVPYLSNQHVYAKSSVQSAESPALTTEGGETWTLNDVEWTAWTALQTSDWVIVTDGKLTVGALGSAADGSSDQTGWFCATNFRLLYGGEVSEDDLKALYDQTLEEAKTLSNDIYYKADKAAYDAAVAENSSATTADEITAALTALNEAQTEAQASINKYEAVQAGSLNDLKTKASDGTYATNQKTVAELAASQMEALEAADDATYTEMDSLTTLLRYYRDNYLPVLGEAEGLNLTDATAKEAMKATIDGQIEKFQNLGTLATTETLDKFIEELQNAINVCTAAEELATGSNDLTSLIVNPTIEGTSNTAELDGWTTYLDNSGNGYTSTRGEAVDGVSTNRYLDAWNPTSGSLRYTAWQTVTNIPNGVYELKAVMRTSGTVGAEGVYLFGFDDPEQVGVADSAALAATYAAVHIQPTDSNYVDPTITKGTAVGYFPNKYGSIWQEAFDAVSDGTATAEQEAYAAANGDKGYGWMYVTLQVTVTNNALTIGVTNDSVLTAGSTDTDGQACVPFSGEWFSCDNWTLTLIQNNEEDYNPATGVETIEQTIIAAPTAIYTIDGRRVSSLDNAPKGIYVIRQENGKTVKVMKR